MSGDGNTQAYCRGRQRSVVPTLVDREQLGLQQGCRHGSGDTTAKQTVDVETIDVVADKDYLDIKASDNAGVTLCLARPQSALLVRGERFGKRPRQSQRQMQISLEACVGGIRAAILASPGRSGRPQPNHVK